MYVNTKDTLPPPFPQWAVLITTWFIDPHTTPPTFLNRSHSTVPTTADQVRKELRRTARCELNHLRINASKTKEGVMDFRRKAPETALVNTQGLDIEILEVYKYLCVHINNKLDWTHNTDVLYKKGQSRLHLLRRLRSLGVCRTLLKTFYDSAVASAIFYAVVCWSCGSSERHRKRPNKLVKRAGSVLDCFLDSIEVVGERRMLAKLTSIMETTPLTPYMRLWGP